MATSSIEWTELTWNPTTGCDKVSAGCKFCYAEVMSRRLQAMGVEKYADGFKVRQHESALAIPYGWKKPAMVFVNSMSDLFHKDVPDDYILAVVRVMRLANWHTYQILTKRSERLRDLLSTSLRDAAAEPHIWWGVSVENQRHGLPRVDHLRAAPATVRLLSVEPLLEDLGVVDLTGIDWVIVGGESGAGARPMNADWVRSLRVV